MAMLPMEILAPLVVGGVGLAVLATRLLAGPTEMRIQGPEHAKELFAVDYPTAQVRDVVVGERGLTALLDLPDAIGAVTVLGDKVVARRIGRGDVERVRHTASDLVLTLADFGVPQLRIRLDEPHRAMWRSTLDRAMQR